MDIDKKWIFQIILARLKSAKHYVLAIRKSIMNLLGINLVAKLMPCGYKPGDENSGLKIGL